MVLLVLALIPSLALAALWGVSTAQLALDWRLQARHAALAERGITLTGDLATALREERRLTAEILADPETSPTALRQQRERTDKAVRAFRSGTGSGTTGLHGELRDALARARDELRVLPEVREDVDDRISTQPVVFGSFTLMIDSALKFTDALGNTDNGAVSVRAQPLTDLMWANETLAREDAVLTRGWAAGHLDKTERSDLVEWIGAQQYLFEDRIASRLPEAEAAFHHDTTLMDAWHTKTVVEQTLLQVPLTEPGDLPREAGRWREAMEELQPRLHELTGRLAADFNRANADSVRDLMVRMVAASAIGLGAVVVVIALTLWLTGSLRQRILALRDEAARLETELPAVVERLQRGEDIDVDAEVREVPHGDDELGRLGQALNLARRSAVETAVRETEQHRGFERLLQRIARRTQLLIGLQLKKLDEMERRHEDPEVLEGLFDLDHLAARLRRYEENLVILGGGQPQRRWRRPVPVLDVLRSALGEVQDYRRIQIEVQGRPWLSERAVGPVAHILAELMENATAFSKPPNPVEARAGLVGRGLVVEIEDRGLGMEPEEYDRLNAMMAEPPRMDMMSRADDARLGLYVVARLAAGLALTLEFRPSVFGGTRVIVMIPAELVADAPEPDAGADADADAGAGAGGSGNTGAGPRSDADADGGRATAAAAGKPLPAARGTAERAEPAGAPAAPAGPSADLPRRSRGQAAAAVAGGGTGTPDGGSRTPDGRTGADGAAVNGTDGGTRPLPRRVRQASLTPELRNPPRRPGTDEDASPHAHPAPERSGATVGAFQRQSRITRGPGSEQDIPPADVSTPQPGGTAREDRE
ncbi:nitrate- and nitrite sensing domain-containing protein [Streptomyces sp. WAC 00631]|uniref:nitrate- and nitrite sensing domain-containing protein n=1 Tax=Streptomyces sp. WAC 00631 TaxID=2203201 RepID=UPI00163BB5C3|nr:nitrate- and nitrite sensing domain-containing protein [Streptomyces sp. WAC 00631]MCC5035814.1 nitrate- and nitrite sensing domain-containing protein [Streptomyces sp. WAC 00631]